MSDPTLFTASAQPITDEAESLADHSEPEVRWSPLVEGVRTGDPAAMEEMYGVLSKGIRFFILRQLGPQDLEERVHDLFLTITQAIQNGELRDPECLMGFVRTVVQRQVVSLIEVNARARHRQVSLEDGVVLRDSKPDPERAALRRQNTEIAVRILNSISRRDREVLIRFYLNEQPAERICCEMGLTESQFRLIKSRAKARFGQPSFLTRGLAKGRCLSRQEKPLQ